MQELWCRCARWAWGPHSPLMSTLCPVEVCCNGLHWQPHLSEFPHLLPPSHAHSAPPSCTLLSHDHSWAVGLVQVLWLLLLHNPDLSLRLLSDITLLPIAMEIPWPWRCRTGPLTHASIHQRGGCWDETTLGPCLWSWVVAELNSLDLCQASLSPQEGQGPLSCATLVRDGANTPCAHITAGVASQLGARLSRLWPARGRARFPACISGQVAELGRTSAWLQWAAQTTDIHLAFGGHMGHRHQQPPVAVGPWTKCLFLKRYSKVKSNLFKFLFRK